MTNSSAKIGHTDLRQRVTNLTASQRVALAQQLKQLGQLTEQPSATAPTTSPRLVAYVVPAPDHAAPDPTVLREALKAKLPAYMVPTLIMPLADLPRTANGKVDVQALPIPQRLNEVSAANLPRTPAEQLLSRIWCEVLGVKAIGIDDNFFELGGDSILSIQIVSKAREEGLHLLPNQLFEQPTIAELAAVANLEKAVTATQAPVVGPVPLTPIQHWFFDQEMATPQHWHQAVVLELAQEISYEQIKSAIATLWRHHDALRLRFIGSQDGCHPSPKTLIETGADINTDINHETQWQQVNADISSDMNELPPVTCFDVSQVDEQDQLKWVTQQGSQLHANLDLAKGPAIQAAFFTRPSDQPNWLLLSLHHLVVDAVSWQILMGDLEKLLNLRQSRPHLPEKTTSFKVWAETLVAQAGTRQSELPFWLRQLESPAIALPCDVPHEQSDTPYPTEATANTLTCTLDAIDTGALLLNVPAAYNTQINDVLLTALAQTLLDWVGLPAGSVRIEAEAHGREQIVPEVDISRTVGWFTATYPICLQLRDANDIGESIKTIKEQLRKVPHRGIGYGLLRYLSDDVTRNRLSQLSPPDILFNYLGQRDFGQQASNPQAASPIITLKQDIDVGLLRAAENRRTYLLEINTWVAQGQLWLNWTYDSQIFAPETIQTVANTYLSALKTIITHCTAQDSGGVTPSDFPDLDFTQAELDICIGQLTQQTQQDLNNIESLYPLAPLQQAFLWHSLQTSTQTGLLQMRGTLHGTVNISLLQQSWQQVVNRHPALRTSIHWQGIKAPIQVVNRQISLPWQDLDWRDHNRQDQALTDFLATDRALGFDLTQSPINRLTIIRLSNTTTELIWSCHHLMLDGWSGTLVVNQVLDTYEALSQGQPLRPLPTPTYQTYLRWLNQQDETAAQAFWKKTLKGFTAPTPLPINIAQSKQSPQLPHGDAPTPPLPHPLSPALTEKVQSFLRSHHLTLNTFLQGIWSLLLYQHSGQSDILFGTTVSGRQADLPQIESVVGLLINVVPVRVAITPETEILDWLQALQTDQATASQYAYASTAQIQSWSDCSGRLFDSLLVVENYPTRNVQSNRSLHLENLQSGIISTYGLTIIAKQDAVLTLYLDAKDIHSPFLRDLLQDLQTLIERIVVTPESSLSQLIPDAKTAIQSAGQATHATFLSEHRKRPLKPDDLPKSPLELQLLQIWSTVLGVKNLTPQDSFFEVGGDSLLAVQIFNQMQQQLGCTLPLATLFQAPTVNQFTTLLGQKQSVAPWSSLVPIQTNGSARPFFFHGGSADALTWARFAQMLGPDQPFYALQRPDLEQNQIQSTTVEALAHQCIQEIRMVQPKGPYRIGGHCFGGAVAFEIAQQLRAQGETIASLILIDAYCPNAHPETPWGKTLEQLQLTYFWLRKTYYYHGSWDRIMDLPSKVWNRVKAGWLTPQRLEFSDQSLSKSSLSPTPNTAQSSLSPSSQVPLLPYQERYALAHQDNIHAAEHYSPRPYSGHIQVFRAKVQILDWRYQQDLGWQTVSQNEVDVVTIPGLFGNLFNQRSGPRLAEQVKAHLSQSR